MKYHKIIRGIIFLLVCANNFNSFAQDETTNNDEEKPVKTKSGKGLHAGLYVGSYFANKYTAILYDGYGVDMEGNRNTFATSFMSRKINDEYGGNNGQPDLIAQQLGVDHGMWSFTESDMPINIKYNVAFMVGLATKLGINKKEAIILNVNSVKLTASGNFTITLDKPLNSNQLYGQYRTFGIRGTEQRLFLQLGYSRIVGDNDNLNFLVEGGLTGNTVKFDKNQIQINNLTLDLTTYYNLPGYAVYRPKGFSGFGLGAFAGLGFNLSMSDKATVQLLYTPSFEKINIGFSPTAKLQNAAGLRFYYNI